MASNPNQAPNESEPTYSYAPETFPSFPQLSHSGWLNVPVHSQTHDRSPYLSYSPHLQPQNNPTTPTSSQNSFSIDSTNNSNSINAIGQNLASSSEIGAKRGTTSTKWKDQQTTVFVHEWKERKKELESSRGTETWRHIVDAVNEAGSPKTVKQCKNKIRNLKQAYKDAKANNKQTGSSPKTSPFFDMFDEVLGTASLSSAMSRCRTLWSSNSSPACWQKLCKIQQVRITSGTLQNLLSRRFKRILHLAFSSPNAHSTVERADENVLLKRL